MHRHSRIFGWLVVCMWSMYLLLAAGPFVLWRVDNRVYAVTFFLGTIAVVWGTGMWFIAVMDGAWENMREEGK